MERHPGSRLTSALNRLLGAWLLGTVLLAVLAGVVNRCRPTPGTALAFAASLLLASLTLLLGGITAALTGLVLCRERWARNRGGALGGLVGGVLLSVLLLALFAGALAAVLSRLGAA